MSRRPSFGEKRRRQLTVRPQVLPLESRNTITEPISVLGLASGAFGGLARLGLMQVGGGRPAPGAGETRGAATGMDPGPSAGRRRLSPVAHDALPLSIAPGVRSAGGGGGGVAAQAIPSPKKTQGRSVVGADPADSVGSAASVAPGLSAPWKPASRPGGGAALAPRGGSGSGAQSAPTAAIQGRSPLPRALSAPAAPPTIPGVFTGGTPATSPASAPGTTVTRNAPAQRLQTGSGTAADVGSSGMGAAVVGSSGGSTTIPENSSSLPYSGSGALSPSFPYYPLYTLDYIQGSVLFPGGYQLATLDGNVDLRAQVKNTTGVTFSWNTTNLTHATGITTSGTGNYDLKFTWTTSNATAAVDSVTLTATNGSSQQETQTYYFQVPAGSSSTNTGTASWAGSLSPDTVLPGDQSWSSDMVTVDANSGAVDATFPLPSDNPNIPGLALTYDSLTADPRPIIVVQHALDGSQAVPSKVNATLTFNGTAGTTWYYDTSQFTPGDVQQIALQASATSLGTGRYAYSAQVVDQRTTNTTITYTGSTTVLNQSTSAFGDGWTLQGLEQITTATGGVILALGAGGRSLWFSGSPGTGGNYTTPAGDFSTLTKTASGYTRTLPDGTQITFNASGYETATIDLNGLHTTYAYNGSNQLSTITDPYSKVTTFSYVSGKLSTIQDPAGRLTTITFTGNNLTAVQQADGSLATYTYDGSGRMTQVKDPNGKVVTVAYDAAERAGTITRPDATTQTFSAYQEQGWTNSGTSGSPAAGTLLAESAANYTDPNGNLTQMRPDWYGLGTTGQVTDALGDVTTNDVNSSGLATVVIDRLNRISQYQYDSLGNVTQLTYPDGNTEQYTYNSYSEPLTHTDANGHTTSYTYDAHGNNTVIQDALLNRTTMTYTSNGRLQTIKDANNNTTTYQYDSQDRLTTTLFPDGTTNLFAYNSQGNTTKVTDGRGNATTSSYDALNRRTGSTDALSNLSTITYDANGNVTKVQAPTPVGQTARTTTYAYDSMNRLTTMTDPLGNQTIYGYDSDGNRITVKDPMSRISTTIYDALNRPTVTIDPMSNRTTVAYDAEGEKLTVTDAMSRVTTYAYSVRGWVATVTDGMGFIATYVYSPTGKETAQYQTSGGSQFQVGGKTYDADDREIASADGLSNLTTYTLDGVGNTIAVKDANGNTTSYTYDSRNRLTTITDALGHTTVYGYDGSGNRQTVTDGLGHTTTTLFDALNRATLMISAIGGTTTITYDAAGRKTSLTDPVGNQTQWGYDASDRMVSMTDPLGHMATYVYDADGELTDTTDRDGRRTTYSYNADGDKTGETWVGASPSEKVTYTYDADNEMTGAADAYATLTFTYDNDGRLSTDATSGPGTGQPTVTLTYGYDQLGDETSVTDSLSSQGITTYSYDNAQRLTTITTSYGGTAGPQVVYGYDSGGRLITESRTIGGHGTQVNTTYSYDAANRQTTITDSYYTPSGGGSGGSGALATYVYGYDQANRVTSETDAEGTATFTYDNANELTAVGGSRTESYSYDLNGNRNATGYTTGTGNELTASPGYTYTYDVDGNLLSQTNTSSHVTTTYTYDYRNRLTQVTVGGTIVATYTYDALDRRIGIKDNGSAQIWTVYDGTSADANPYADFTGASGGGLKERYLFGPGVVNGALVDQILARTNATGTTAWYLTDKLGSVRDIVSSSATVLDHIVYDSFGNIVTETNAANGDRFKFAGMEYDATIGQYYDRARDYSSNSGRFTAQDPKGFAARSMNLYGYVGNGPLNLVDTSGEYPDKLQVAVMMDQIRGQGEWMKLRGDVNNAQAALDKVNGQIASLDNSIGALTLKNEQLIADQNRLGGGWVGATAFLLALTVTVEVLKPYAPAAATGATTPPSAIATLLVMITVFVIVFGAVSFALDAQCDNLQGQINENLNQIAKYQQTQAKLLAQLPALQSALDAARQAENDGDNGAF